MRDNPIRITPLEGRVYHNAGGGDYRVLSIKEGYSEDESTGWKLLANAIILQAIRDYRDALITQAELLRFLRSDYFQTLSRGAVSADAIIQKVIENGQS